MSVYAIILNEPSENAWKAVKDNWPEHCYFLTDRIVFIAPDNGVVLTSQIAKEIGMDDEGKVTGLVMESAAHTGFNDMRLWEWMRKVE